MSRYKPGTIFIGSPIGGEPYDWEIPLLQDELIIWALALILDNQQRQERKLDRILRLENQEVATIQEILDDETTETSDLAALVEVVGSLNQSVVDLQALVAELQANAGGLTAEQQTQLDAINAAQDANRATIESLLPTP